MSRFSFGAFTNVSLLRESKPYTSFFFSGTYTVIRFYRVFSQDVTAAMLVSQNKEIAAMLVSQTKLLGTELYFYANTFFCFSKPIWLLHVDLLCNILFCNYKCQVVQLICLLATRLCIHNYESLLHHFSLYVH